MGNEQSKVNGQNQTDKSNKLFKRNKKQKAVEQLSPEQQELLKLQIKRDWIQKECSGIQAKQDNLDVIIHQNINKIDELQKKYDYLTNQAKQAVINKQTAKAKQLLMTRKQIEQSIKTQSFYQSKYQEQFETLEGYLTNLQQYRDTINITYMQQQENIDKLLDDMQTAGYNLQLIRQTAEQINQHAQIQVESEDDELADEYLKLEQEIADDIKKQVQIQPIQEQQVQDQPQQQKQEQVQQPQQIAQ